MGHGGRGLEGRVEGGVWRVGWREGSGGRGGGRGLEGGVEGGVWRAGWREGSGGWGGGRGLEGGMDLGGVCCLWLAVHRT